MIAGQLAAGDCRADHENVLPQALPAVAMDALLAVVLLIRAVKLQRAEFSLLNLSLSSAQLLGDRAAQEVAIQLDRFGGGSFSDAVSFSVMDGEESGGSPRAVAVDTIEKLYLSMRSALIRLFRLRW